MSFLALALLVSLLINVLVIRLMASNKRLFVETGFEKPQRFHDEHVPRAGGIGILVAIASAAALGALLEADSTAEFAGLLVCSIPAFASGLAEDLTHRVSARRRLAFTVASALMAVWLLDAVILRTDLYGLDALIAYFPFAVLLTLFTVTGVANSVNIIDGFNGLASMCVLMMSSAVAYVAFQVGDNFVGMAAMAVIGATLGFFVLNFPAGSIFLGDGGAYLLGFLVAELGVLLLHRNPQVSPLFPLLLCAYPIFETVFTIYRRTVVQRVATAAPDGIHLHSLVHRRLIRRDPSGVAQRSQLTRNSMTSPYLWGLCATSVIPSVLWWRDSRVLGGSIVVFMVIYVLLYRSIVHFKTPKWLTRKR